MTGRPTRIGAPGLQPQPGELLLAPGDAHMTLVKTGPVIHVRLERKRAASGCLPSVDPMLASIGRVYGASAVGVILSGMGRDGVIGAGDLVGAGGAVLAQDEASSVVWGMPGAIANARLAQAVMPPDQLARRIAAWSEGDSADMTPLAARALAGLLEQSTGQQLVVARRWRIETALAPVMRAHGITSLDMLAGLAAQPGSALREDVVEALLNHETSFYRDLAVFKAIGDEAMPTLAPARAATRRLRIWSAGCSTGQETYSLAFLFSNQADRWSDWAIDILGSDVSPQAIAQARNGVYSQFEVQRGLPISDLLARFEQEGEDWRIKSMLKARTNFMVHNLLDPSPPGRFDMILCRNVLLYFSAERRRKVLDRLADAIAPDGLLILGAGETVLGQTDAFAPDPKLRGVYRPAAKA